MWVTFQLHQRHLILIVLMRMKVPWQVRERSMNKLTLSSSFVLLWSCRSCSRRCRISSTKSRHIIKKPHLQPRTQTELWCEFRFPTWRTPTNTKISIEGVGGSHFKTVKSCFLGSFMLLLRQVSVGKWNSLIPNLQVLHLVGWNRTEKSPKEHEADRNSDKWLPPCASALLWTDLFLSWRKVGKSHTLNIWPVWSHLTDNLHQIVLSCTYS